MERGRILDLIEKENSSEPEKRCSRILPMGKQRLKQKL